MAKVTLRAESADPPRVVELENPLNRWRAVVVTSPDPCLVLDDEGIVVGMSPAARELLGCEGAVAGQHLLEVVALVDLDTATLDPPYSFRVGPLAVLGAPGLSRSLIRVRRPDGVLATLDVVSVPLHDAGGSLTGSLTFLAPV